MVWAMLSRGAGKTRVGSFLLLAFSSALLFSGCAIRRPANDYLIAGNEYFKKGDYKNAELQYRDALKSDPKSPTAKNNLGVILNEEGQYDEAISTLRNAIELDPKNSIAHYVLSEALAKKSRFEEAFAEAKTATELDATEPRAFCALAEAALGRGDIATAIDAYRDACRIDSSDINHHKLALVLGQSGNLDEQIKEERAALELEPDNLDARVGLATALVEKGEKQEAVQELKLILSKNKDHAEARAILARIK